MLVHIIHVANGRVVVEIKLGVANGLVEPKPILSFLITGGNLCPDLPEGGRLVYRMRFYVVNVHQRIENRRQTSVHAHLGGVVVDKYLFVVHIRVGHRVGNIAHVVHSYI